MTKRLILDTDIGTDVDDCLALALILGSPELELVGVTTVYGDVDLRARMVRRLLALHGTSAVPVLRGASDTLRGELPIHWEGHEGQGLVEEPDLVASTGEEPAVDFIVRTAREQPGQVHLLAIGPLTNVALVLQRDPDVPLAGITIMGGAVNGTEPTFAEHNLRSDPEAAAVGFTSGLPITLVPFDITTRVAITLEDVAAIAAVGSPFHLAVADQARRYPPFARNGRTSLHDPLAAAILARPELVTWADVHLVIDAEGRTIVHPATEDAAANVHLAVDVDVAAAEAFIVSRVAAPLPD